MNIGYLDPWGLYLPARPRANLCMHAGHSGWCEAMHVARSCQGCGNPENR